MDNKFFALSSILALGTFIFLAALGVYLFQSLDIRKIDQITVSGEGKIYAKPDIALVNLGIETTRNTTAEAISANTEKMNTVIQAVKDAGVEEKDIQTTNYNLSPLYNYTEAAGRVFQGYVLTQNLQVKIRDFEKVGSIMQQAVAKGANLAGNLQFTIENPEQFRQEARAKAIEQAKSNAQNLAEVSGIKLGKLTNIYENYYPYSMDYGMGGASESAMKTVSAPRIEPGQSEISVTVNLTYRLK